MLSSGEAQFSLNQVKCFARLKANRRPKEPQQQHHLFKSKEKWKSKGRKGGGGGVSKLRLVTCSGNANALVLKTEAKASSVFDMHAPLSGQSERSPEEGGRSGGGEAVADAR